MSEYISGVCNIGPAEIQQRKRVALGGFVALVICYIALIATGAATATRWVLFFPAAIAAIGFVQARRKFCLAYGFMGTFNFGQLGHLSKTQSVEEKRTDRKVALSILAQGVLLALVVTALLVAIPL